VANGLGIPLHARQFIREPFGGEMTGILARLILGTRTSSAGRADNHWTARHEWLEEYLRHFAGTVLVISHDRWFLDAVVSAPSRSKRKAVLQRRLQLLFGETAAAGGAAEKYEKDQKELRRGRSAAACTSGARATSA
jgi:hypothetical protein